MTCCASMAIRVPSIASTNQEPSILCLKPCSPLPPFLTHDAGRRARPGTHILRVLGGRAGHVVRVGSRRPVLRIDGLALGDWPTVPTKLGWASLFGLGLAIWSANAGMKAVIDALNVIYDEEEKRGFIKLNLVSLAFTLGAIAAILLAIGAVVVAPLVFSLVGLAE